MTKPEAASGRTFASRVRVAAALLVPVGKLLAAIGAIMGAMAVIIGLIAQLPCCSPTPSPSNVRITFPVDETVVDQTQTIRGTSRSLPAGSVIWVVVFSPAGSRYYPQNESAVMEAGGSWSSTAYFGTGADANERFDILALVADSEVQKSFVDYQKESRAKGEWLGLQSLPAMDVPVSRVPVIRRAPPTPTPTPDVSITYPVNQALVDQTETIRGTSRAIPVGSVIWMVVFSPDVGRYYPQNEPAVMEANGAWSTTAYVGVVADTNKRFDILALMADKGVQDLFTAYLAESKERRQWPGIQSPPIGGLPLDRVSVIRQ